MRARLESSAPMLANAGTLIGTTAITSGMGSVYWWLATRLYAPNAIGLASAIVSAMMLLASLGVLGLGTVLLGELPRQPDQARSLISTSLGAVGVASTGLGVLFAVAAPCLSAEFAVLAQGPVTVALFAGGVALTAATLVLDQAVIGLFRGDLQLRRNVLFALAKLVLLLAAGLGLAAKGGFTIYVTWLMGQMLSLAVLVAAVARRGLALDAYRPRWALLRQLGYPALGHHALNLVLQAPGLVLPILVTVMLSASQNAGFYMAWMIANLAYAGPSALATVLYAAGAADPVVLGHRMRLTLALSLAISALGGSILLVGAGPALNLFGHTYAEQAAWSLRVLVLAAFPMIIKDHYVATCRVQCRIAGAARLLGAGALLEVTLAAAGARLGGLVGLTLGWLLALCCEALVTAPAVLGSLHNRRASRELEQGA